MLCKSFTKAKARERQELNVLMWEVAGVKGSGKMGEVNGSYADEAAVAKAIMNVS